MNAKTVNVGVIGGGAVGLCTAYYLARQGAEVVVYDAGAEADRNASWGNAGHVLPVMSTPVTSLTNIKDAARSLVRSDSFVTLPKSISPKIVRFAGTFARNSTHARWSQSLAYLAPLNRRAITEYEGLQSEGVDVGFRRAPFVSAFMSPKHVTAQLADFARVASSGIPVEVELVNETELAKREPLARDAGRFGVIVKNQGLLNPPLLIRSLRAALAARGVKIKDRHRILSVERCNSGDIKVTSVNRLSALHDKVVIATGAWLDELADAHGVRTRVLAGFGYSLKVETKSLPSGMLYFPETKIATTLLVDSLRVSTLLQVDEPSGEYRQESGRRLLSTAKRVMPHVEWSTVTDTWHGARPISTTGRPVIGETGTKDVYVNGGHGMWGVTLAPISGRLLSEAVLAGRSSIVYPGFDVCAGS